MDTRDDTDSAKITAELDDCGGALLPQLLTREETEQIRDLYDRVDLFRSTVDLGRYRFGQGEYRYFDVPYPDRIERLKLALYPRLLPIARDWWSKLGREAIWTDDLRDWLERCHKRDRRSQLRSCSSTGRTTGTPCTATSTASSCSRFRW